MPVWSTITFCLFASLYLLLSQNGEFTGSFLLKILPLLLLLALLLRTPNRPRWLVLALCLSMLGDVLLALDGRNWFVYGLAAFLLSHLTYIQVMRPLVRFRWHWPLPYLLFAAVVLGLMWPGLGAMAWPVLAYIGVILAMSLSTWCSGQHNRWLVAGGLLFISSDTLLGLNKFWQPLPMAGLLIMLTYYGAQYALIRGFLQAAQAAQTKRPAGTAVELAAPTQAETQT